MESSPHSRSAANSWNLGSGDVQKTHQRSQLPTLQLKQQDLGSRGK